MRRLLFLTLGVLELGSAILLVAIAYQLPGSADVEDATDRLLAVTRDAGAQVRALRDDCARMRRRQPELLALTERLERQIRLVGDNVKGRSLDAEGLATVTEALGQVADGLDGFATGLDPKGVANIGKGLGATASYLDEKMLPAAAAAAASLEKAGSGLKADAGTLARLLDEKPIDLKRLRAVVESLARFEEGLDRMSKVARVENFEQMRDGVKGLETSLDAGAGQVDRMGTFKLPQVSLRGFMPSVTEKPFWPDAKTVADGMRKAAKGAGAAGREMEAFNKELPRFQASVVQSRKVVTALRESLARAVANEEKVEPVLLRLPRHLARLADDLPRLTAELARVLRDTEKLKEIAAAMRQAEKGIDAAVTRWPEMRSSLARSADLLRQTRKQLRVALGHRDQYEEMLQQTVRLTTMFAEALPVLLRQLEDGLSRQEGSLGGLGDSIDQVGEAVAPAGRSAALLLVTTRMLLALVAVMVGLHAAYVLVGAAIPRLVEKPR
ncbi:MAG: hypothetical protein U0797_10085 [Gemmataceae bacterium]